MVSAHAIVQRLLAHARGAAPLSEFRAACLAEIEKGVPFDAALFHELSPRVSFARAALVGLDPAALAASSASWDENAVVLGRLRDLALEGDGVVTDREAFPVRSPGRAAFEQRVARPLGIRSLLMAHLLVADRVISAVLLFRRGSGPFASAEVDFLRGIVPALSVCDASKQLALDADLRGPPIRTRCVDQRLTPRQREIVERVALGHTNEQIADALDVSANTVRNLLTEVRRRLGAANRAEVVRVAVLR